MRLPGTGLVTHLEVGERNLARESADDTLRRIKAGELSRGVLPWVPLMSGAEDGMIMERWKRLAEIEPVSRRRSEFAGLAVVFATAAKRREKWELALEGWNMIECSIMDDWIAKGEAKGLAKGESRAAVESLLKILKARFGQLPEDLTTKIQTANKSETLQGWIDLALQSESLVAFRASAQT